MLWRKISFITYFLPNLKNIFHVYLYVIYFLYVCGARNIKYYFNDKFITTKQTKQNYWGSVLVQVHSLFRCLSFDVSRSDYPSLLNNQNIFIMRETKDNEVLSSLLTLSDAVQMILMDENTTIEYKSEVRSAFMVVSERITNERTFPVEQGVNLTGRTAVC